MKKIFIYFSLICLFPIGNSSADKITTDYDKQIPITFQPIVNDILLPSLSVRYQSMYINATKVIADGAFHSIDLNSIEINNDLYVAANGHFVNRKETLKFDFETYNFITIGKNFKINQDLMVGGLFGYYRLTDDEKIGHNGKILLVGELLKP